MPETLCIMGNGKVITKTLHPSYKTPKDIQNHLKLLLEVYMKEVDIIESGYATFGIENKGFWYCWRTREEKGQGFIPFKK